MSKRIKNKPSKCSVCDEKAKGRYEGIWYCNKHICRMYRNGTLKLQEKKSTNLYKFVNNYVEITTCKGIVFYIDKIDFDKVKNYSWCVNGTGMVVARVNGKVVRLQKHLLNYGDDLVVDHINGNTLDNRRNNMRVCLQIKNSRNGSMPKNAKLPYLGLQKVSTGYVAHIGFNYQQIHLGTFRTLEEAIKARQKAEIKYFGEFAPCLSALKHLNILGE